MLRINYFKIDGEIVILEKYYIYQIILLYLINHDQWYWWPQPGQWLTLSIKNHGSCF